MRVSAWVLVGFVFASFTGAFGQAPSIPPDGVVNGATFLSPAEQPPAPGSIISIFGTNFALPTAATSTASAQEIPLPTSLGGVSLSVNNVPVPLVFVSHVVVNGVAQGQINAQMPWEVDTSSGMATLTITRQSDMMSSNVQIPVADNAPGIFTFQFGPGLAAVQNFKLDPDDDVIANSIAQAEGSVCPVLNQPPGCVVEQPAKAGGIIIVFANGLGPVDPPAETGNNSTDALRNTTIQPPATRVLIGGQQAQVFFSGLQQFFVGLNQLNVGVPEGVQPGDAVPIQIEQDVNGVTVRSRSDVTIAVRAAP